MANDTQLEALRSDIEAMSFDEELDPDGKTQLLENMCRVIGFKAKAGKAPLGASKIGGKPHAASGFEWPSAENIYNGDEVEPMAFLLQLDLAQLAANDKSGTIPPSTKGTVLFFALPIEYDPDAFRTQVHVVESPSTEIEPPKSLKAGQGRFTEKVLEPFPTVVFPDPNGGFLSFDDENDKRVKKLLKKHDIQSTEVDALLRSARFSPSETFDPESDVLLFRMFGEELKCKDGSLWFETEMLFVISKEALEARNLDQARLVMGEGT